MVFDPINPFYQFSYFSTPLFALTAVALLVSVWSLWRGKYALTSWSAATMVALMVVSTLTYTLNYIVMGNMDRAVGSGAGYSPGLYALATVTIVLGAQFMAFNAYRTYRAVKDRNLLGSLAFFSLAMVFGSVATNAVWWFGLMSNTGTNDDFGQTTALDIQSWLLFFATTAIVVLAFVVTGKTIHLIESQGWRILPIHETPEEQRLLAGTGPVPDTDIHDTQFTGPTNPGDIFPRTDHN